MGKKAGTVAKKLVMGAQFSPCRTWRYALWRKWNPSGHNLCAFIGLNPSTADEFTDDPTIRRCIGYAKGWGYDGLYMLNVFAFRATEPKDMKAAKDPVGPYNDRALALTCGNVNLVVAAWGVHGSYCGRCYEVERSLKAHNLRCLGITKGGLPKHPLYLKKDLQPITLTEARGGRNP